jgi:hypothetical protein
MESAAPAIVWFRQNLPLSDNPALQAALEHEARSSRSSSGLPMKEAPGVIAREAGFPIWQNYPTTRFINRGRRPRPSWPRRESNSIATIPNRSSAFRFRARSPWRPIKRSSEPETAGKELPQRTQRTQSQNKFSAFFAVEPAGRGPFIREIRGIRGSFLPLLSRTLVVCSRSL